MDETLKKTTGGLALALALGGCGSEPEPPPNRDPIAVEASIKESLDRLRALELVEAGKLVMHLPAEATACYGLVCAGWETRVAEERSHQATRLTGLVDLAAVTAGATNLRPREAGEAAAALRALSALEIIEVQGLVQRQLVRSPECYNLPCPWDIEARDRENARRVTIVFSVVERAQKKGL
jgi:hypothetical protein